MRKLKIYLDTSIISYLHQEDAPEKTQETRELWEQFKHRQDIEIIISDLAVREIYQCKEPKRSLMFNELGQMHYILIKTTDEEKELANTYLHSGVLKEKSIDDLTHIAIATLIDCRYIVSWNFKHFVNPKTINAVNLINQSLNLPQISIFSPSMMLGGF